MRKETSSAKEGRGSNFREKLLVSLTYDLNFCVIGLRCIQEKLITDLPVTLKSLSLCEKCHYSELFWSAFFRIRTEYGEILRISPYSVRMRKNMDQNNSEYGHFLRIVLFIFESK